MLVASTASARVDELGAPARCRVPRPPQPHDLCRSRRRPAVCRPRKRPSALTKRRGRWRSTRSSWPGGGVPQHDRDHLPFSPRRPLHDPKRWLCNAPGSPEKVPTGPCSHCAAAPASCFQTKTHSRGFSNDDSEISRYAVGGEGQLIGLIHAAASARKTFGLGTLRSSRRAFVHDWHNSTAAPLAVRRN